MVTAASDATRHGNLGPDHRVPLAMTKVSFYDAKLSKCSPRTAGPVIAPAPGGGGGGLLSRPCDSSADMRGHEVLGEYRFEGRWWRARVDGRSAARMASWWCSFIASLMNTVAQ